MALAPSPRAGSCHVSTGLATTSHPSSVTSTVSVYAQAGQKWFRSSTWGSSSGRRESGCSWRDRARRVVGPQTCSSRKFLDGARGPLRSRRKRQVSSLRATPTVSAAVTGMPPSITCASRWGLADAFGCEAAPRAVGGIGVEVAIASRRPRRGRSAAPV